MKDQYLKAQTLLSANATKQEIFRAFNTIKMMYTGCSIEEASCYFTVYSALALQIYVT